jgi:hypothetical protein
MYTSERSDILIVICGSAASWIIDKVVNNKGGLQTIEDMCFSKDGALVNEFDKLYTALFNRAERHIQVVSALAKKSKGLTRTEIFKDR